MLILSRGQGQDIKIGEHITVHVRSISGRRVSLGVTAPAQVRIVRAELDTFSKCPSCCSLHPGRGKCGICKEAEGHA